MCTNGSATNSVIPEVRACAREEAAPNGDKVCWRSLLRERKAATTNVDKVCDARSARLHQGRGSSNNGEKLFMEEAAATNGSRVCV